MEENKKKVIDLNVINPNAIFGVGDLIVFAWNWRRDLHPILAFFDGTYIYYGGWSEVREIDILMKIEMGRIKSIPRGWRRKDEASSSWLLKEFFSAYSCTPEVLKKTISEKPFTKLVAYKLLY